jgi:hypothetical protein
VLYYRLKQTDKDGQFTYSTIVALSLDNKNVVLLYPNPVKQSANLTISVNAPEDVQCRIIGNLGQTLRSQRFQVLAGSNTFTINVGNLPKGVYHVELKGKTINSIKELVKIN